MKTFAKLGPIQFELGIHTQKGVRRETEINYELDWK
jgi:hypothetical protein